MSDSTARRPFLSRRARVIVQAAAVFVVVAVVATIAIVVQGYDVKQVQVGDGTVWVLKKDTANGGSQYARVDANLHEVTTVRAVDKPAALVQNTTSAVLFTASGAKMQTIDLASPVDVPVDSENLVNAPLHAARAEQSGQWVAFLDPDSGQVMVSDLVDGEQAATQVNPYAGEPAPQQTGGGGASEERVYVSRAISVDQSGRLFSFSSADAAVIEYDAVTGKVVRTDAVTGLARTAEADPFEITSVGGEWVLLDVATGEVFTRAHPSATAGAPRAETADAVRLQTANDQSASIAYLATADGLFGIDPRSGDTSTVDLGADPPTGATPARPTVVQSNDPITATVVSTVYSAWLSATAGWISQDGGAAEPLVSVPDPGDDPTEERSPVIQVSGATAVLNDEATGLAWRVADRSFIVGSDSYQDPAETAPPTSNGQKVVEQTDPTPPHATADRFGVRAGETAVLPVLLNDWDENDDVLSIDPASVTSVPSSFGVVSTTTDDQRLSIEVRPGATGSERLRYRVTDGGLFSALVSVTVTVRANGAKNDAPRFCGGDAECEAVQSEPTLDVRVGESGRVQALSSWVDPDGDPIYVSDVHTEGLKGTLSADPDGTVFYRSVPGIGSESGTATLTISDVPSDPGIAVRTTTYALPVVVSAAPKVRTEGFIVRTSPGATATIDPAAHIVGAGAGYTLELGTPPSGATVRVNPDASTMTFSAAKAGSYLVDYVATTDGGQAAGIVRVDVVASSSTAISIAPTTIYVHSRLDSTVSVFSAVSNPAGHLLALDEVKYEQGPDTYLDVSVLGHAQLRVVAELETGAQQGYVGTVHYTVADIDAGGRTTQGVATVVMLPNDSASAPIANQDNVIVRAGQRIDVPVLDNDVSTDGNPLVLDPSSVTAKNFPGLAFGSGSVVRIVAPTAPGDYTVAYSVYSGGSPTLSDRGTIAVTVTAAGANVAPVPHDLSGRVLSGQTVSIPFDGYRVDPDGDPVRLSRIVTQPEAGTASISADGASLVYQSVDGTSGSQQFEFEVKDTGGKVGTAVARVGVLSAAEETAPIVTATDYVEVQRGQRDVHIRPLDNDVDSLNRGSLSFDPGKTPVIPDVAVDTARYASLAGLIDDVDRDSGVVTMHAGDSAGTQIFQYTVVNAAGSTADGYIVVNVVDDAVPDVPRVSDSYVTIDDRARFENEGIDVLSGKAVWQSGDAASLTVEPWNAPDGVSVVDGRRITGTLPTGDTLVIPFSVTGIDNSGERVTTFGFLVVPGPDDIVLTLKAGAAAVSVPEAGSVAIDLESLISIPSGDSLVFDAGGKPAPSGQRAAATCTGKGPRFTYAAGRDAPFSDTCSVSVRLASQSHFTRFVVPIDIVPINPTPSLTSVQDKVDISKEWSAPFDLSRMVTWAHDKASPDPLVFVVGSSSTPFVQFELVRASNGESTLRYRAANDALPGSKATVQISLGGKFTAISPVIFTVTVQKPPEDHPRGAHVSTTCNVQTDRGGGCAVTAIGGAGEYNPADKGFGATDMTIVSFSNGSSTASCDNGVTVRIQGTRLVADWPKDIDGLTCEVHFIVSAPAHGESSGSGNGEANFEIQGRPRAPTMQQVGYHDREIVFAVTPDRSSRPSPGIDDYRIYALGSSRPVGSCGLDDNSSVNPTALCIVDTSDNGVKHRYQVSALNDAGESPKSASVSAYAYTAPEIGDVTWVPKYVNGKTTDSVGWGDLHISNGNSPDYVTKYAITATSGSATVEREVNRSGSAAGGWDADTSLEWSLDPGRWDFTVVPILNPGPPPCGADSSLCDDVDVQSVATGQAVIGAPKVTSDAPAVSRQSTNGGATTVSFKGWTASANGAPGSQTHVYWYAWSSDESEPSCAAASNGSEITPTGAHVSSANNASLSGLTTYRFYSARACAFNGYGYAKMSSVLSFFASSNNTIPRPDGLSYSVAAAATGSGTVSWLVDTWDDVPDSVPTDTELKWRKGSNGALVDDPRQLDFGGVTGVLDVQALFCNVDFHSVCSDPRQVPGTSGRAAQEIVTFRGSFAPCIQGEALTGYEVDGLPNSSTARGTSAITSARFTKANAEGAQTDIAWTPGTPVPADAQFVSTIVVQVSWSGRDVSGLTPYSATYETTPIACAPAPPDGGDGG